MNGRPLISVILPAYNAEAYIEEAVRSALAQTWSELEVLVVDDGSADRTREICEQLAKADGRLRVLSRENGGAAAARNTGIAEAKGDFFCFLDADDRLLPRMVEDLYNGWAERRNPLVLAQIGRIEEDEEGNRLPDDVNSNEAPLLLSPEKFLRSLLLCTGDSSFCTKLVSRDLLANRRFPEGVLGEDFLLHMQLLPDAAGVWILPEKGYVVRHRRGSATRRKDASGFSRAYIDIVNHADTVDREILPQYPALREEARFFSLYQRLLYLLHVPVEDMTGDNTFYTDVVAWLRAHREDIRTNPYLSSKHRRYLQLLSRCPVLARKTHRLLKGKTLK